MKKFYAINRETGERWKPKKKYSSFGYKQYLVMYDSGYLAVVTHDISFGSDSPNFNIDTYEWRIKPEKKNKFDPYFYECDNEYHLDVMSLHRDHVSLSQKELAQVLFELNQKNAELLEEKNEHEYSDDEYFWNGLDEL